MKKSYSIGLYCLFFILFVWVCKNYDENSPDPGVVVSPVNHDLNAMPFSKLSEYNFFISPLKELSPVYGVLPYEPINSLFTDYAHKKRFIWMPDNVSASYNGDGKIFNFPVGTILIKNFIYEEMLPNQTQEIIETRLMIRKETDWIFANYIWNEDQTEAFYNLEGENRNIEFMENGLARTANYRIPNELECLTCHKNQEIPTPIGVKPQNLNKNFSFAGTNINQLVKWKEFGYLNSYPSNIETVPNWEDSGISLENRVRAYVDINCSHCHSTGAHCDYTPMRFSFNLTTDSAMLGICVPNIEPLPSINFIVQSGNPLRSALAYRMNTNQENIRMPMLGRSIIHEEALTLVNQWINSLEYNCE